MRNRYDRPGIFLQEAFEPRNTLGIEMIRRLVE